MLRATTQSEPAPIPDALPDVPLTQRPRHIAIIMDGNGRWAQQRGRPRVFGHRRGAAAVRAAITESSKLGIGYLTLYSFSVENWKRPQDEIRGLMGLYARYLRWERAALHRNNVRILLIGKREGLPPAVLRELDESIRVTRNNSGLTLCLALNYGAREELVSAVRRLAEQARAGALDPAAITESSISDSLYTAGIPDPDLVLRTAGEQRVSNFLLWQISYAEFLSLDVLWPDFTAAHVREAVREFARRKRRFGGIESVQGR